MSDEPRRVKPPGELNQDRRRLKRRRVIARLGLREAAAKAQISFGYLSDLENGYKSAGPETLGKLADAYGCDIEGLMPPESNGAAA
jgi:transcriptional regulator with XRE-family HTH domain